MKKPKVKMKPVKRWGVVSENREMLASFRDKASAACYCEANERVARVLITEIGK